MIAYNVHLIDVWYIDIFDYRPAFNFVQSQTKKEKGAKFKQKFQKYHSCGKIQNRKKK